MIDPKHEIPLATAINSSAVGRRALVDALYHECQSLFKNTPTKTTTVSKHRSASKAANGTHITASVTDNASGLFVQLTGLVDASGEVKDGPFLVFGKKYLEESKSAQLSNTAVKLWR